MTSLVFYFQVHQPHRLRRYRFFDIGRSEHYFDDGENRRILERVAEKCYLPMNALLLRLVERHQGRFRCAFSVSGTALDQMERWSPETLASFQRLARTGCVEFLGETSHHSLAALGDKDEFAAQVNDQAARVEALFGTRPRVFRNTELILSNDIARMAENLGFIGILGEGADHLLGWRSPHRVYRPEGTQRIKLMLRSYKLSDDIAFRFSNRGWSEWPLVAERFASWVHALPEEDRFVGLFMDYETFGEHQWRDTGIFDFMEALPGEVLKHPRFSFETPTQVALSTDPTARLDVPHPVSWADAERDLTAWLDNAMQTAAHRAVYALAERVRTLAAAGDVDVQRTWRKLTTSDHFYYMCVKFFSDGDVHKYFSPYATPHDAYIALANVLADFSARLAVKAAQLDATSQDELTPHPPIRLVASPAARSDANTGASAGAASTER
jgi:alpha-amylase